VEESVKSSSDFNGLADFLGAHQYPYEEYGERREEMRAMKTQKPGLDTGLKALSLRACALSDALSDKGGNFTFWVSASASRMISQAHP
jgi:hypothetical protein